MQNSKLLDWGKIHAKLDKWREIITDKKNHLHIDFESYYDDEYSLSKLTTIEYVMGAKFKLHSVAAAWGNDGPIEYVEDKDVITYCRDMVGSNPNTVMCGQNLMFDGLVMTQICQAHPAFYIDLMGLSRACLPHERFHNLDAISKRFFPNDPTMRKGNELVYTKGLTELSPAMHGKLRPYNIQDINIQRASLYFILDQGFPTDELLVADLLMKMMTEPPFVADMELLREISFKAHKERNDAVAEALVQMKQKVQDPHFFTSVDQRPKDEFRTQKSYNEWYKTQYGFLPIKKQDEEIKFLSSNGKFAEYLKRGHGIDVPMKDSPTPSNPYNETWALAKDDVPFQEMMAKHRNLEAIWMGRKLSKSSSSATRADRLIVNAELMDGMLSIPIKYGAAHTHRFGGGEKVNPQNFKRTPPKGGKGYKVTNAHRHALTAPKGKVVGVADSSNIEARKAAWFCEFDEKLEMFHTGGDPYNVMATEIFGYEVDRKKKDENGNDIFKQEGMVGKATELGCNYQMGDARFKLYLNAGPMGMPPIFLEDVEALKGIKNPYKFVVDAFRRKNYAIRDMWKRLETVLMDMTNPNTDYEMQGIRVMYQRIILPSGLALHYPRLSRRYDDFNQRYSWMYYSADGWTGIFGGKLLENIIQALSRVVVSDQMLWTAAFLDDYDSRVVMQVHDEIITLLREDIADELQAACNEIMRMPPKWCHDIPLNSEGGYDYCYSK